jgi:hypothetical protein
MKWLFTEKDKLLNLLGGIILSQLIVFILALFTTSIILPVIISLLVSSSVVYGRELLFDNKLGIKVYKSKSFIASEIGVIYGIIISLLILLL